MGFINNDRFGISENIGNVKQFIKEIAIANWILDGEEYYTEINHALATDNIVVSIYKDGTKMSMNNVEIINATTIKLYNDVAMNCKVIIIAKEEVDGTTFKELETKIEKVDESLEHIKNEKKEIKINVMYPPVESGLDGLTHEVVDQYQKYQNLVLWARAKYGWTSSLTMEFPNGKFYFSKFPLHIYTNVIGQGKRNTYFYALDDELSKYFIFLNSDPVQMCRIKGITIQGNSTYNAIKNPLQTGLSIVGGNEDNINNKGGCWYCTFEDLEVRGFSKNALEITMYSDTSTGANQFLKFINCQFVKINTEESRSFKGGANQSIFIGCCFDNEINRGVGTNIECTGAMEFDTLSTEGAEYGLVCNSGIATLNNPWFENIGYALTSNGGDIISNGGYFANAGGNISTTGSIATTNSINGYIYLNYPRIEGTTDYHINETMTTQKGGIYINGITSLKVKKERKTHQVNYLEETPPTLFRKKTILVNDGSVIKNIKDVYQTGETVTFKSLGNITVKTGGNISLLKNITLNLGDTITLIKSDVGGEWTVMSVFKHSLIS